MESKKCTNCSRAPQPLSEFIGRRCEPCTTCKKCREKGKLHDKKPERIKKHKELMDVKGSEYSRLSRERIKNGQVKTHVMDQTCVWASNEKSRERVSAWKKKNVNEKLGHSKRSAISRGHEWYISDEFAKELFVQPCHYCGFLDLDETCNGIDRMDNSKPYIPSNCLSCCKKCNYAKRVLDYYEFINLCKTISSRF